MPRRWAAFPLAVARPAQALLMTKLSHETQAARSPGKRPYVITRAGAAGLSRYAQTWSGDNETAWKTLRYNLAQGLTMSLSGMFNIGHDVGGFHGPSPGPELFCRFVEFCSLWPRFVMNSWNDDGVVTLPWMHPEMIDPIRDAIRLRYRLMPYLYTALWRAARDHEPVVRPLLYGFPDDPAALTVDDAFLLGPDLLVAPVLEPDAQDRAVYLPAHEGGWFDLRTGEPFVGSAVATVPAPFGRLPVFVRAGSVIPVSDLLTGIDPAGDTARTLLVFGEPKTRASADLYEDDGDIFDWRRAGLHLRFGLERNGGVAAISAEVSGRYRPAWTRIAVTRLGPGLPLSAVPGPVNLVVV